jgi:hypothetical protein
MMLGEFEGPRDQRIWRINKLSAWPTVLDDDLRRRPTGNDPATPMGVTPLAGRGEVKAAL